MSQIITKGIKELLAEADAIAETITVEEAQKYIDSDAHVFIDIRDARELKREGKIPGAFSAPRGMLEFWVDSKSPYHKEIFNQDKEYIFYCASSWRSALAIKTVTEMGMKSVVHLKGGFSEWKKLGAPLEEIS